MTHTNKFQPKNDVDIAYEILAIQGRPMYYHDIIKEVLNQRQIPLDPASISEILTQINLDARFNYVGKSEWGLRVWTTSKGIKKLTNILAANANLPDDEDDFIDDHDEEEFDLDDEPMKNGSLETGNDISGNKEFGRKKAVY